MSNDCGSNIWKFYVLRTLEFAWFPIPTIVLFYQSHGISLEGAVILKTVLSFSIFIFEIPSGYLADVLGRKKSLVAGGFIWTFSLLLYCFGTNFWVFVIAEMLAGLAASLISGADAALAFDTLLTMGKEREYLKLSGRLVAIAGFSEAICGIIGAWMAAINLVYPFYLQTIFIAGYCLIALTLIEPIRHLSPPENSQLKQLLKVIKFALVENQQLKWLICFSASASTATFLIVWLAQAYMQQRGLSTATFGVAWAFFHLVMSLASLFAPRIETLLKPQKTFLFIVLLLGFSYIFLAGIKSVWGIIFIAVIYLVRGIKTPIIQTYINRQVASNIRATILSINSFAFRLCFVIVGPISSWIINLFSLDIALVIFGVVFLFVGIFSLRNLERV